MNRVKTLATLWAMLCLPCTLRASGVDEELAAATRVALEEKAPGFSCRGTDGREFALPALKGKVVLLYFFSSDVPVCLREMKYLEAEVHAKLRDREDFQMIAIGRGHSREELVRVGGENRLTFPLVPDQALEIYNRYFTKFVPRTVLVRKDGTIGYLASGYHELEGIPKLQAAVARELARQAP